MSKKRSVKFSTILSVVYGTLMGIAFYHSLNSFLFGICYGVIWTVVFLGIFKRNEKSDKKGI